MFEASSAFARRMLKWYRRHRRDLPWRVSQGLPDAYHVLVSEAMLQQTQVATVIPYFLRFLRDFPTIQDLAAADEQAVLRSWQGLGYYSRARSLRRAAQAVLERHGGRIPSDAQKLLDLPGVGRYTAGAIGSLAFDKRVPILDGNVSRVLCRLDAITEAPANPEVQRRLWARAEELLPAKGCGDFNSSLMELGATICTPRNPSCLLCPVSSHCEAFAKGLTDRIPCPKTRKPTPLNRRLVLCLLRARGSGPEVLIEQRPAKGRWASMWQFPTYPVTKAVPWDAVEADLGPIPGRRRVARVKHALTHRRYEFDVFAAIGAGATASDKSRRWVGLDRLCDYPLPRPHVLISRLLLAHASQSTPLAPPAGKLYVRG